MKPIHACFALLCALALQGCVQMPQTAEEFRKAAPGAFMATKKFSVNWTCWTRSLRFSRRTPASWNS